MTNEEIKRELERIAASLAEQERITADLTRRVEILESKVGGKPTSWGIIWPDSKQGGKRGN
jgi:hypothetical protein